MKRILLFAIVVLCNVASYAQKPAVFASNEPNAASANKANAPMKADASNADMVWGYYTGDASGYGGLGFSQAGTFRFCMFVPGDRVLAGSKITAVRVPGFAPSMTLQSVWGGTKMGGTTAFNKSFTGTYNSNGYNVIQLDEPVDIPAEGLYVGYTVKIPALNDEKDKYPFGIAKGIVAPGSLYLSNAATGAFTDYSGDGYGCGAMQLVVTGANVVDNGAYVKVAYPDVVEKGDYCFTEVVVGSDCRQGAEVISYVLNINGEEREDEAVLNLEPGFGRAGSFVIEYNAPMTAGANPASITITHVNGVPNEEADKTYEFKIPVVSRKADRYTIVEEYTGTTCGWCPRGWVGMGKLKEIWPDKMGVIAMHQYGGQSDPMYYANYAKVGFTGAPQCSIDRIVYPDPYFGENNEGIDVTALLYNFRTPPVVVSVDKAMWDANHKNVMVNATTEFLTGCEDYTVAYVLTADGLKGTTAAWKQYNYYADYTAAKWGIKDPDLMPFCKDGEYGSSPVMLPYYDDVLVGSSYNSSGDNKADPFASFVDMGETVETSYNVPLTTKTTCVNAIKNNNYERVFATVMVVDQYGRIANAARVPVVEYNDADGIENLSTESPVATGYYTLDGKRINAPVSGVCIERMADGTVRKVLVK